ncbi:MAG: 4Fe-4S binding protein [Methanocellales archaeon]
MISVNREKCGYCGACVAVCPNNAIELLEMILLIGNNCDECKICIKMCPVGALEVRN